MTDATPTPAAEPQPSAGGWFRNIGEAVLTLVHETETVVAHPSRILQLAWTPIHRDMVAAAESDFAGQAEADAKAAAERAAARAAVAAESGIATAAAKVEDAVAPPAAAPAAAPKTAAAAATPAPAAAAPAPADAKPEA